MKIKKFIEYNYDNMTYDFINSFDEIIIESNKNIYKNIQNKIISDLGINSKFILTYGVGIGAIYPIVEKLMKNSSISVEITIDKIVLLSIAALTIIYIEEGKCKNIKEESILNKDSKNMLEELKMSGIGNGIVKKIIKAIKSIKSIFNIISKHILSSISGVIDMFSYVSLLIPILNGILFIVGKYELNIDTIYQNFIGLSIGIGTIIAKHGIIEIIRKIKNKFDINVKSVISEIESPVIQKFSDFSHQDQELIKEH